MGELDTATERPKVCKTCGYRLTRDWAGYMHTPGYYGKRHKIVPIDAEPDEEER